MKLTREEFKEYVSLYEQAWEYFRKYGDIIDENLLDELLFPMFNWMDKKLGIDKYSDWWDLFDLFEYCDRGIPIEYELIQVGEDDWEVTKEVRSKDLDLIYDKWFGGNTND